MKAGDHGHQKTWWIWCFAISAKYCRQQAPRSSTRLHNFCITTTWTQTIAVVRPVARAGTWDSPRTLNLLQFVIGRVLANNESSKNVQPVLGAVHELGLRQGSDRAKEYNASASDDRDGRGSDHRNVVRGRQEAPLCHHQSTRDYGLLGNRCDDILMVLQAGRPGQTSLRYVEDSDEDEPWACTPGRLQPLGMGMYSANGPIYSGIYSANDSISSTSKITTFQATFCPMSSASRTRTRHKYFEYTNFDDDLD